MSPETVAPARPLRRPRALHLRSLGRIVGAGLRGGLLPLLALALAAPAPASPRPQEAENEHHGHQGHDQPTADHSFADVDRWVGVFESPDRAEWQMPEEVVRALGLSPGGVVADIGAGTGYFTFPLARAVGPEGKVLAIDVEPNMVTHLQERARAEDTPWVEAILVPGDSPGVPEGTADCVLIVDTYHHIHDRIDYLGKLRKGLAPDGEVVVIDFFKRELPVGPPPQHKMTREEVIAEFEEAGYVLRREETFLPYQYFLRFETAGGTGLP